MPALVELLRDGFCLDHVYGIVMDAGTEGHALHGGGTADGMRCGLTVVGWNLADVNPGDGGFACIPGSHKANYNAPPDVVRLAGSACRAPTTVSGSSPSVTQPEYA